MTAAVLPLAGGSVAEERATCLHCGSAVAAGSTDSFCCRGCAAAHSLIRGLGLDQYYIRRAFDPAQRLPRPEEEPVDLSAQVTTDADGICTLQAAVDGLHCGACVWLIESVLAREADLIEGRVNMTTRRLTLRWRGGAAKASALARLVTRLGYRLVPFDARALAATRDGAERELLRAMAVAGFAAANVMLLSVSVWAGHAQGMGEATRDLMHWISALIALPAIVYAGRPFFRSALAALRAGRTNMDVPISIGVTLAAAMSLFETVHSGAHAYFNSAITLLFFLLVGRYLELRARARARGAVEQLAILRAVTATVIGADGAMRAVAAAKVAPGDVVLAAAGERIAVDGRVLDGASDVDTSLVTGESVPSAVKPGERVYAGTVNLTAPLRIAVTAAGESTLLADIERWMEAAERGRSRFVALADRVARRYAPVVHLAALATFLGWIWIGDASWQAALLTAVAVLIITCPCALALAVPVVQVVAGGRLMRGGVLLKSGTALERLAAIDTVVFDKTGTLTLGRPELQPDSRRDPVDLRLAAQIASASRHPLAAALLRACPEAQPIAGVAEHPGRGLSLARAEGEVRLGSRVFCAVAEAAEAGEGSSGPELWLAQPGRRPVRFTFVDRLRPDAQQVIAALKSAGLRVELLSGDRDAVVSSVATELGIDAWQAGADPGTKLRRLEALSVEGRRVLMVGDGLNDAPALAAAWVSASPATAADVSQTAADAVFQGDRLSPVTELLAVARRAERLVRQNLATALVYNLAAVPLAMLGHVTPLIAAIAMSSSSLLVIGNALRLRRGGGR